MNHKDISEQIFFPANNWIENEPGYFEAIKTGCACMVTRQ